MNGFELRKQKKMQQIEEATEILINQKGLENTTIQEIADLAKVSKGTIFNYYDSKEGLAKVIFMNYFKKIKEEFADLFAQELDFETTFREITKLKLKLSEETNVNFYESIMQLFSEEDNFILEEYKKKGMEQTEELLRKGREEGKISSRYSDELLHLYLNLFIEGVKKPEIYQNIFPFTEEIITMFLNGLN
ncbi:MAG: TetR/AcrR family transcriptional regulator [Lactobacillales bacterium]|nr:TetR/AcrR family transcriptional regulator [Lactobacillales bacterium]